MKERPILFSGAMVRAILDGSKTQTRRAFNERTIKGFKSAAQIGEVSHFIDAGVLGKNDTSYILEFCPYGQIGDRLWVRESFSKWDDGFVYAATCSEQERALSKFKPSIHMPRAASRITLEIVNIRVERLQDISEEDAKSEGFDNSQTDAAISVGWFEKPVRAFRRLWESINGAESWALNPWVWVIEFKRV